ncbi:MAG: hypothetical protein ACFB6R_05845 [Alphaproteobacteria bacterium]
MVIFRILAQILIAAALMLLGADALDSLEAGTIQLRSLAAFTELLHLGNPDQALSAWDESFYRDGLLYLVRLPAWVTLGFAGVLLAWASAPRYRDGA